jgi:PDZ domain-containing protein/aspartyl protease
VRHAALAVLLVVPSLLLGSPHDAALHPGASPPSLRFEPAVDSEEITIPFQSINHHIILSVTVNGEGPFQIILDTGMPMEDVMLYDSERVKALKLPYLDNAQVRVSGAGGKGKGMSARIAPGITLGIGGLRILEERATVVSMPPGFAGYHEGVIGAALFRHFAVSIDNDRGLLTLRKPEAYRPPAGAKSVPLVFEHGRAFVDANVRIGSSESVPARLIVDLGASHSVSLNESKERGIRVPGHSIETGIGRGVSGEIMGRVGRIRGLEIGGWTLSDVIATFPDKAFHSPRGMDSRDGNLGNGALGRFNVTLDYEGKRMILEPARGFSEPFEWDMSGIQAEPTAQGAIRVRRVLAGSPAAKADIQEGDRIVKIGGQEVNETTFFSLKERLKKNGETIVVELERDDKPIVASLKLQRLV